MAAAVIAAAAFGMLIWFNHGAMTDDEALAAKCPKEIGGIPMTTDFVPRGERARTEIRRKILYVVIHETDNTAKGASAKAHNKFIRENGKNNPLSWHYTVDDKEIYHHIPDEEAAYHAGDAMGEGSGNLNGIGIEMCVNEDGDYEKTLENSSKLVAYLLEKYDLDLEDVKKHQDFNGKVCPNQLITKGRWQEFLDMITVEMKK